MNPEVLKNLRERTGLTAFAFGKELEARKITTLNTYYLIERGGSQGRPDTLTGIARVLAEHLPGTTPLGVLGEILEVEA